MIDPFSNLVYSTTGLDAKTIAYYFKDWLSLSSVEELESDESPWTKYDFDTVIDFNSLEKTVYYTSSSDSAEWLFSLEDCIMSVKI